MDALTPPSGKPRKLAAAKLRRAAIEAGIGPDDLLAPLMDAVANVVSEVDASAERIEAAVDGMRDHPLSADQIRTMTSDIGSRLLRAGRLFERSANWKTALYFAAAVALLASGGVAALTFAYGQGRSAGYAIATAEYAEARAHLVTAPELSAALAAGDATWWRTLIVNNPTPSAAMRDCAVQNGRHACYFALWVDAAGPAPVIKGPDLATDPNAAEGKAPVKAQP